MTISNFETPAIISNELLCGINVGLRSCVMLTVISLNTLKYERIAELQNLESVTGVGSILIEGR